MNKKEGNLLKKVYVALFLVAVVTIVVVFSSDLVEERFRTPIPTRNPTPTWQEWQASAEGISYMTLVRCAEEIPYMTLVRYAEQHKGKLVYYRGRVGHVFERRGEFQLSVDVTPDNKYPFDATVFLRYKVAPGRVQFGDIIIFVGRMNGTVSYSSVMGTDVDSTVLDITALALTIEYEQYLSNLNQCDCYPKSKFEERLSHSCDGANGRKGLQLLRRRAIPCGGPHRRL